MKNQHFFILAFMALMLPSCTSTKFYQVYKVQPGAELVQKDDALVFEDENCRIIYNLWGEGGNIGFQFFNKTDQTIILNMEESFYIRNQVAHDYYRERVMTYTVNSGASAFLYGAALSNVNGESVSYQEEKQIQVPPGVSKIISEYEISESLIRNCDLFLYPKKRQIGKVRYNQDSTPIEISNRISYSVGSGNVPVLVENSFYVSEIANYPENEFLEKEYEENCGERNMLPTTFYKESGPGMFYLSYEKSSTDHSEH